MRTSAAMMGVVGLLGIGVASAASADPPQRPGVQTLEVKPVFGYTNGVVEFDVTVHNPEHIALSQAPIVITPVAGGAPFNGSVDVPALGDAKALVYDRDGLKGGQFCSSNSFDIRVGDGFPQRFAVNPTCRFTPSVIDPRDQEVPDRVDAGQSGRIYIDTVKFDNKVVCSEQMRFTVTVVNQSHVAAQGVQIVATPTTGTTVTSIPFNVPAATFDKNGVLQAFGTGSINVYTPWVIGSDTKLSMVTHQDAVKNLYIPTALSTHVTPLCALGVKPL